jgi:predicted GNAT superfamily acetyltransferase
VLVFLDGDYSSLPCELPVVLEPVLSGKADLCQGSRELGSIQVGAMPPQQRFGNRLASWLMRRLYRLPMTDLGPYRSIRRNLLLSLDMREMTYGWPTEMTVKAARTGLRFVEVPVSWRKRQVGRSKVSGTLRGTLLAAWFILGVTLRYALRPATEPKSVPMEIQVRPFTEDDLADILALNLGALSQVSPLDSQGIKWFAETTAYFRVAESKGKVAGFLIAVDHDSNYQSIYFQWFNERYPAFLYIDRVIVAEWARGKRVAWRLFEDVERFAASSGYPLTSDAYSRPPNEISLAFHQKYGFELVGTQSVEGGAKEVTKFYKEPSCTTKDTSIDLQGSAR